MAVWSAAVLALVVALGPALRVQALQGPTHAHDTSAWALLKYRAFKNHSHAIFLERPQRECQPQRNTATLRVTAHVTYECHGSTSVRRLSYAADDRDCTGTGKAEDIAAPVAVDADVEGGGWNLTCVHPDTVVPYRRVNQSAPDPFYTRSPINTARCSPRVARTDNHRGVTVITFVDRPGHLGHSNFVHSLRAHGYGPHINIDVDLKTGCEAQARQDALEAHELYKEEHTLECVYRQRLAQYLPKLRALPEDEVVLISDTFDALLAVPADEFRNTFLSAYTCLDGNPCRVVIASEMLCDTRSCREDKVTKDKVMSMVPASSRGTRYQFLNAGSIVGYAGALSPLFECVIALMDKPQYRGDDQAAMTVCYVQNGRQQWTIDYDTKLIAVVSPDPAMFDPEWSIVEGTPEGPSTSPLRRKGPWGDKDSGPGIIHFAGVRYLDIDGQRFNPCQLHLAKVYNAVVAAVRYPALTAWQKRRTRPRIVVSLTTLPTRIAGVVATVKSLLAQSVVPDALYINIPTESARFKDASYTIPPSLSTLKGVTIRRTHDHGPATKLIPTLEVEKDPSTVIVTADDDMLYKPSMIHELLEAHLREPNVAYGFAGQMIDLDWCNLTLAWPGVCLSRVHVRSADNYRDRHAAVDILEAFKGAMYRRSFFNLDTLSQIPSTCHRTDDIWISAALALAGVPRVKLLTNHHPDPSPNDAVTPLRDDNIQGVGRNDQCALLLLDTFLTERNLKPSACPIMYVPLNASLATNDQDFNPHAYHDGFFSPCTRVDRPRIGWYIVLGVVAVGAVAHRRSPRFRTAVRRVVMWVMSQPIVSRVTSRLVSFSGSASSQTLPRH
eukprot:m.171598 g.171598  ORF g.171598 m.171598 type:complete len:838 (-) comp13395_c0_seq1:46-2559(-)